MKLKKVYPQSLFITAAKKKDLVTLCKDKVIPSLYEGFYSSLPCSHVAGKDMVPDEDSDDNSDDDL